MAVLTAQGISSVAIALLTRSLVLPRTATAVPGNEFAGSNGDTITVRVPQPGSARTQASAGASITYDDVTEIAVDVTLAHLYHGKRISDEELSLELEDFARQITRVQVDAVATGAEDELATAMNDLAAQIEFAATATDDDTLSTILEARELLGEADCPSDDRFLAVSPSIATRLLSVDGLRNVDQSGAPSALRDATIGKIFGFMVVESNALTTDTAVAYHRSGFAFANRVPVAPRGANDSASSNHDGVGLRQIFQYQPDILSDASVVSTFAGASAVADVTSPSSGTDYPRIVKIGVSS